MAQLRPTHGPWRWQRHLGSLRERRNRVDFSVLQCQFLMPKSTETLNFESFNSFRTWHLSGSPAASASCAAWLSSCGVPHSLQEVAVAHP